MEKGSSMANQLQLLILDDEPIVGKRLAPALNKLGCEIETFEDPEIALKRIGEKEFHIVVTDVRMENIDGLQVLEQVLVKSPKTKVIMITGYATIEIAREALAKGAFDFIAKPFTPGDLRKIVTEAAKALGFSLKYDAEAA
jgi:DNA-binding NtrC family response regulator